MEGRAAVLWGVGERWKVETIHVSPPVTGEVLVQWEASGLCHSDDHFVTGDFVMPEELRLQYGLPSPFPMIGGHEGAGTVLEVDLGSRAWHRETWSPHPSFPPAAGVGGAYRPTEHL